MHQWDRLPVSDAAGTASADTTETQIGAGLKVPSWARSILAAHIQVAPLVLTTKEEITGYFRLANDEGGIDPLNFPLPMSVCLTGAIGTHVSPLSLTVPCLSKVTPEDIIRAYMALDAATTGVHQLAIHLLFSDKGVPYQMHGEKSAATAVATTAGTLTTGVDIDTITGKTKAVMGFGASFLVYPTVDETFGGHIIVSSKEAGWLEQRMPFGMAGSGLSTQVTPFTLPSFMLPKELKDYLSQVIYMPFPDPFPMQGKGTFTFKNTPIVDQSVAGNGRYFLYWQG